MKKISLVLMSFTLGIMLSFVSFDSTAWAKTTRKVVGKQLLPDLIVSSIVLVKDCKIKVTIKNNGLGGVPEQGYHATRGAAVQMVNNGNPWGGLRLASFDPGKKLKTPGASVSHIWFPGAANLNLGPGTHQISVTVDKNNAVKESNEKNKTAIVRAGCKKPSGKGSGDLTIKIQKCPVTVTAGQKLGSSFQVFAKSTFASSLSSVAVDIILSSNSMYPSPAPYAAYSSNYSDKVLLLGGREHISFAGPGSIPVKLNGTNQIPSDTPPGIYYLGAVVDAGNKVSESNERNNVAFCRIRVNPDTQRLPDLVVSGFSYTGSAAGAPLVPRLLVTINNLGPAAIPLGTGARLKVYVDSSQVAVIDLDSTDVEQTAYHDVHHAYDPDNPSKSRSIVSTDYVFPSSSSGGSYTSRVVAVIDYTNKIPESNETNNSFIRVEVIPAH